MYDTARRVACAAKRLYPRDRAEGRHTVNGSGDGKRRSHRQADAIPPLKLRGALAGTYLHLIEARGDVVIGPSEISLKASDVGIVGLGKSGQLIDSFGYALKLNGQERSYRNETYEGIYFPGSEALKLNLPNNTINAIVLAFDNGVTEAEIQAVLSVTQDSVDLPIHWLGSAAQMDPDAKINAMTIGDMKKSEDDGKAYRCGTPCCAPAPSAWRVPSSPGGSGGSDDRAVGLMSQSYPALQIQYGKAPAARGCGRFSSFMCRSSAETAVQRGKTAAVPLPQRRAVGIVPQPSGIQPGVGQLQEVDGLDDTGAQLTGSAHLRVQQHILHKFRAVVAVRPFPENAEKRQQQPQQVIGKLLPPRPHGLQRRFQRGVPLLGDLHRENDGGGIGETAERPRVGGFDDEAAPEGVVGVSAPEGVHLFQIRRQAEGCVVVLRAGDALQDTGQNRTRLADDNKYLLVVSVHIAPSHSGGLIRLRAVRSAEPAFRCVFHRLTGHGLPIPQGRISF